MSDASTNTATEPPTPGWLSTFCVFSIAILGALPTSGLFDGHPVLTKLAGLVTVGLAAIGFMTHKASLKEVHANAEKRVALARAPASTPIPSSNPNTAHAHFFEEHPSYEIHSHRSCSELRRLYVRLRRTVSSCSLACFLARLLIDRGTAFE